MREREFQAKLIKRLRYMFEDCVILKSDANYLQGFPDLIIFFNRRWAALEVKASAEFDVQPNQGYYVELLNEMSFASFIYPENEEEVLYDLQSALESNRSTRFSER